MDRLMLIVRMGGENVALPADMVESVVEIEAITPVPLAPPHIAGLAALRSRVLTVIDPHAALGRAPFVPEALASAVIVPIDGHPYGIMVDEVLDVMPADEAMQTLRAPAQGDWAAVARGTVTVDGKLYLLIDPARLIRGPAALPG